MSENENGSSEMETLKLELGPYTITCTDEPAPFTMTGTVLDSGTEGVHLLELVFSSDTPAILPPISLKWFHPMVDTHLRWMTRMAGASAIMPWKMASSVPARVTSQAPVYGLLTLDGTNRLTFAISDALNNSLLRAQLFEEDALLHCAVELQNNARTTRTEHRVTLRMDTRPVPTSTALAEVADWWAGLPGYEPMPVPDTARLPMYSTWYSFHLGITPDAIEEQCRLAKPIGMDAVIVDDGWQTDDCNRGYSYCGDWEVALSKFPDFAGHVKRVQDLGMKYLLWFSVPFVGRHSKAWERFQDKLLPGREDADWRTFDPRWPDVREYLTNIYRDFVTRYNIDGLKLDFVDSFAEPAEEDEACPAGRDNLSVAEAAAMLMSGVADALQEIKPDIMLEFRESYIGPFMRRCGNIFRVGDVPNDFHNNRIHSIDLRQVSGATAVHSDMMMWHPDDSPESAALQLLHTLFSVPQVSVLLDRIPESHRTMLAHYLSFWRAQRELLLDGDFMPLQPGMGYPQVKVQDENAFLAALYGPVPVELPDSVPGRVWLVNATLETRVWLCAGAQAGSSWRLTARDCQGRVTHEDPALTLQAMQELKVPAAGTVLLEKN